MDNSLKGKVAIITGASRGIGKAIAHAFAAAGMRVFINARTAADVTQAVQALRLEGYAADELVGNAASEEFVCVAVKKVVDSAGAIDILVNNAGVYAQADIAKITLAEWESVLRTNLTAPFLWTREVTPHLQARHAGKIINIASVSGLSGRQQSAHYAASKGGLIALTKAAAKDLARYNVTVNAVAPSWVNTDLTQQLPPAVKERERERTPLGRLGTPSDIAGVALFLASPAADFITGEVIRVDGGRFM